MKIWVIEPRDALIVRDGRPFGPNPGARATSLGFPFPSTTTGVVRTRAGLDGNGIFTASVEESLKIEVKGPLLVELNDQGDIARWLFPAPADAMVFESEEDSQKLDLYALSPATLPSGTETNLPDGLHPVALTCDIKNKPSSHAPRFWSADNFDLWLKNTAPRKSIALETLGHNGPETETRTHVNIAPDTQTAKDGALFQTRGLEFSRQLPKKEGAQDHDPAPFLFHRLALAVWTETTRVKPGIAPMGGERRLVMWRESNHSLPACPVIEDIKKTRACRVILVTSAHFEAGYRPQWLLQERFGVTPTLEAMAIQRYQTVSGWDFAKPKGQPKPTRRLAPAGTVLFLSFKDADPAAIETWIHHIWMHCVSDDPQSRKDGFGLAALGAWSGELEKMEVAQ